MTQLKLFITKYGDKLLPFSLTALVILLDQITKAIIVRNWPIPPGQRWVFITDVFNNDFLRIIHVRNPAIAFSIGQNLPEPLKPILFVILPVAVLIFLVFYYFKSDEFTNIQRWALAGITGGGIGNIIDRIFRRSTGGVVDFIDVRFFGIENIPILRWERWPTFNVADSAVVVCCLILFVTILFVSQKNKEGAANEQKS